ncbi:hypothetical protein ACFW04_013898 [Cataglyphis niger]
MSALESGRPISIGLTITYVHLLSCGSKQAYSANNVLTAGTSMDSPLHSIIVDIVLQYLETKDLDSLKFTPFYIRYLDGIALAAPSSLLNILDIFNTFHSRLQFSIEIRKENRFNFLDVIMILNNNFLSFNWYKPTFSGRYLHSCRIIFFVKREKKFELVINILIDNGYLLNFIFKVLYKRRKTSFHNMQILYNIIYTQNKSNSNNKKHADESEKVLYFTILYIPLISEQFKNFTKDLNKKYSCPQSTRNNVVYKINCINCDASYVGQIKRQLYTRITEHKTEHKNHIRRNTALL